MGFIYIIRNTKNEKVYIGQTITTVETRFYRHLLACKNFTNNCKLYQAMREIGPDNFYVTTLGEYYDHDLNYWENHFVIAYNSVDCGYNSVYPDTCTRPVRDRAIEDNVISDFLEGYSFAEISKRNNISTQTINEFLKKHNVSRDETTIINTGHGARTLIMYDLDFNPLRVFESIKEAVEWLNANTSYASSTFGKYAYIDSACANGNVAYGHRWQDVADLVFNHILFRTKFDKQMYINGSLYKIINGYAVCEGALNSIKTLKMYRCRDCGVPIKRGETRCVMCSVAYNARLEEKNNKYPSDKELAILVKTMSWLELGEQIGVSSNAVRMYCKRHGITR